MRNHRTNLIAKLVEASKSVLPVSAIVLFLCLTITPIDIASLTSFIFGTAILIVGIALFTIGAEISMSPMGEFVGAQMTRSRKIWLIIILSFIVGFMITMSEPDLQVLATYAPSIDKNALIWSVSAGVGAFLVVAMLRILFGIRLKYLLMVFYAVVFVLSIFVPKDFWAIAFDSGGVTTGPMTVPFIMALGVGVSSIRSDSKEGSDSFGLVALCSIGPIMAVMILGLIVGAEGSASSELIAATATNSRELGLSFLTAIPKYMAEIAIALLPIVVFFFVYQAFTKPLTKKNLLQIFIGILYTFVGLVLFLTGANVGFMPAGSMIGTFLGNSNFIYLAIPIGMVIGYFIVAAEPAVQVLQKQVEDVTSGAIPKKALAFALEIGVAISVGIAILRAITGMSILWPILIGYGIAFILTFFVPEIFTSIAFDSGGVASGALTTTFLLPFSIGLCTAVGGNVVTDAFGTVAMVAMTPLIAIQILGVVYKVRMKKIGTVSPVADEHGNIEPLETTGQHPTIDICEETGEISLLNVSQALDLEIIDFEEV